MDVVDEDWHGEDLSNGLESVPVVVERSADALAFPEFQVTFGSSSVSLSAVKPVYSGGVA